MTLIEQAIAELEAAERQAEQSRFDLKPGVPRAKIDGKAWGLHEARLILLRLMAQEGGA